MKSRSLFTIISLVIMLTSYGFDLSAKTPSPSKKINTQTQSATGVWVHQGRLTVRVQNDSLASVLDRIAQGGGVTILYADSLQTEYISAEIKDQPFDEGLRTLLVGYDSLFFVEATVKEAGNKNKNGHVTSFKKVWVYPKGQGEAFMPVSGGQQINSEPIDQKSADQEPLTRAETVEQLVMQADPRALDAVQTALTDWNPQVREQVLIAAVNGGIVLPQETILRLVQYDGSPQIRAIALDLISGGGYTDENGLIRIDMRSAVQGALNDRDPEVRARAEQIWTQLTLIESSQQSTTNQGGPTGEISNIELIGMSGDLTPPVKDE